ncbi:MAG TPA: hypothetical protein VIZ61_11950 [Solirubrobacterales bacterium]
MPQIIVRAAPGDRPGAVTLQERVTGSDLNSDQFASRLVERMGWALLDAEDIEESARHVGREQIVDRGEKDPELASCDLPAHGEPLYLD